MSGLDFGSHFLREPLESYFVTLVSGESVENVFRFYKRVVVAVSADEIEDVSFVEVALAISIEFGEEEFVVGVRAPRELFECVLEFGLERHHRSEQRAKMDSDVR